MVEFLLDFGFLKQETEISSVSKYTIGTFSLVCGTNAHFINILTSQYQSTDKSLIHGSGDKRFPLIEQFSKRSSCVLGEYTVQVG